jgi:hypothetical protein
MAKDIGELPFTPAGKPGDRLMEYSCDETTWIATKVI